MGHTPLKNARSKSEAAVREITVRDGSANVFADLGFPNAEDQLVKAQLASAVNAIIAKRNWTQAQAAEILRTVQPTISDLSRGRFRGISVERLMEWLVALDHDVEIHVRPKAAKRSAHMAVAIAS